MDCHNLGHPKSLLIRYNKTQIERFGNLENATVKLLRVELQRGLEPRSKIMKLKNSSQKCIESAIFLLAAHIPPHCTVHGKLRFCFHTLLATKAK